ncbi:MAG: N-acetyltransferase [Anaerotruncus sp.]|nr:N-acetyltransferase [Anaerotruncus sp.]
MNYQYESNRIFASSVTGVLLAEVTFPNRDEKRVNVDHVFVDESLRGQGVAGELMKLAYDYIKGRNLFGLCEVPVCHRLV